jgi:cytochrome c553
MKVITNTLICSAIGLTSFVTMAATPSSFKAGEHLFRTAGGYGCSACHGLFANGAGNVGGNIRGKTLEDINHSLATEPTMMLLANALSNGDKENLALYLQTLGKIHLVEWTIEDKPLNFNVSIEPDKPTQLVLFNKTFEGIDLNLPKSITEQSIQLSPYKTKALEWTPDIGVIKLNYNQSHLTIDVK